jgi:hypothetical protein
MTFLLLFGSYLSTYNQRYSMKGKLNNKDKKEEPSRYFSEVFFWTFHYLKGKFLHKEW